ncbi:MAG: hypothetical protein R3C49_05620 [Planctomycetaceae bacterium]
MTDPAESNPSPSPSEETPESQSASEAGQVVGMSPAEDELPDDYELTPELVEEEAIRGDFMLRWAAIFLAVLFGFSQISDSRTLVHVRSGEYLRSHGFLPIGSDPFSYALDGRSSGNVSWLFDHLLSLAYAAGGPIGLTIFKAAIAAVVAWLLSHISLRGMPTWWSSICSVLAVAACSVDFVPTTDLMTLLGLSITLLLLHRFSEGNDQGLLWKFPLLTAVWCNLDSRAWLGIIAIVLYALGNRFRKSAAEKANEAPGQDSGILWKAGALCVAALLLNPSPLASLLSPVATYSTEYPLQMSMNPLPQGHGLLDGRTESYSLLDEGVLTSFEFAYVAGFALIVIAVIVLLISRSRNDVPWAVVLLGFTGLAVLKLHELPAASLVAAAAAGTAAQRWYSRTFRQEYSTDTMEVLFSRGGRAVTVFGMAALGFLAVADRLPTRNSIGPGFDPELQATMESLEKELSVLPDDARVLNTHLTQGDLLIWHGRQAFADSRPLAFGRVADPLSVISRFDELRRSLLETDQPADQPAGKSSDETSTEPNSSGTATAGVNPDWKKSYDAAGITHVMLRLSPPGPPAYSHVQAFSRAPQWTLVERGPSAAIFRWTGSDPDGPKFSLRDLAFRTELPDDHPDPERFDYAGDPGFYREYLYESRDPLPAPMREAQNILQLDMLPAQGIFQVAQASGGNPQQKELMDVLGRALAGPTLAVRRANEALRTDSDNPHGYRILGAAYRSLGMSEEAIARAMGGSSAAETRYLQTVLALRQSARLDPKNSAVWQMLSEVYGERNRIDLALECINRFLELDEERLLLNPDADQFLTQVYEQRAAWEGQVENVKTQLQTVLEQAAPEDPQQQAIQKLQIVQELAGNGHVRLALEQISANESLLQPIPPAELLRGKLLLESGNGEDAFQVLNRLAEVARERKDSPEFAGLSWHQPVAVSHLGKAGYAGAISAYQTFLSLFDRADTANPELSSALLKTLPLVAAVDSRIGGPLPVWPLSLLQTAEVPMTMIPRGKQETIFLKALVHLEEGNLSAARQELERIISDGGDTTYRPLAAIYLIQLTDDAMPLLKESFVNSWEDFEFPSAAVKAADAADPGKTETPQGADAAGPKPEVAKPTADQPAEELSEKPADEAPADDSASTESADGKSEQPKPAE